MECPKCHKKVNPVCYQENCRCMKDSKPENRLIWKAQFMRLPINYWMFEKLWSRFPKLRKYMVELEKCPHCGNTQLFDCWFEYEMEQSYKPVAKIANTKGSNND